MECHSVPGTKVVEITFLSNWVKETNDGDLIKLVKILIVLKSNG